MLQGGILFVAIVFVLVNLLVDISYAIINPRIRLYQPSVAELEAAASSTLERADGRALARRVVAACGATRARSSASCSSPSFVVVAIFAPLIAPYDPRAQT